MSYSIAEEEIKTIGPEFLEGHYAAWNYMMAIDTPASKEFAENYKEFTDDPDAVVADPKNLHITWFIFGSCSREGWYI